MSSGKKSVNLVRLAVVVGALLLLWGCFSALRPLDGFADVVPEPHYYTDCSDEGSYNPAWEGNIMAECYDIADLYPGTYSLTVSYATKAAGGSFEVFDAASNATLAVGTYDPETTQTTVEFTLTELLPLLKVRTRVGAGALALGQCEVRSKGLVFADAYWYTGLLAVVLLALWWVIRRWRQGHSRPLQLFLLNLVFCLPFVRTDLPGGHDYEFHLSRIIGLAMGLLEGQFPVRINLDYLCGAGYIQPVMYPELFLYPSGIMAALRASTLLAYLVLLILTTTATTYIAYYAGKELLGERTGLAFAFLYLCCPYRLEDIYIRAAVGEALAMAFLPLAAVGIYQLMQGDYRRGFFNSIFGITGVLQSHIITTFILVLFGVVYGLAVVLCDGRRFFAEGKRLLTLVGAAAGTVLLNLWLLVPFLHYSAWPLAIFNEEGELAETRLPLWQIFFGDANRASRLQLCIGVVHLVGVALVVYGLVTRKGEAHRRKIALGLLALGGVAALLTSEWFPWDKLVEFAVVQATFCKLQFAWRILAAIAVLFCLLTAMAMNWAWENHCRPVTLLLAALACYGAVVSGWEYVQPESVTLKNHSEGWSHNRVYEGQYLTEDSYVGAVTRAAISGCVPEEERLHVTEFSKKGTTVTFAFVNDDPAQVARVRVPLYYYDVYRARLEGVPGNLPVAASTVQADCPMLAVTIPEGYAEGRITVFYREPNRFRMAEGISLLTLLALCGCGMFQKKQSRP